MKRVFVGSALPVLTLGLAWAFVGPTLLESSSGEPLRVASANPAPAFQLTAFAGDDCARAALAGGSDDASDLRIVTLTLSEEDGRMAVDLEDMAPGATPDGATVVLLLDGSGRLLAAGDASALGTDAARQALVSHCGEVEDQPGAI